MTTLYEMGMDFRLAEKAHAEMGLGNEIPQHIEREYHESLATIIELYVPSQSVIRLVEEAEVRIPPPPASIVAFLERTVEASGKASPEATTWMRKAKEAIERIELEESSLSESEMRWLQRVKAARPGLNYARNGQSR